MLAVPERALSLSQPWAWMMTIPAPPDRKEVENRSRPCPPKMIGQSFAVHAAKSWDDQGAGYIRAEGFRFPLRHEIIRGAVVAVAVLARQVTSGAEISATQQRWWFGPYGYIFADLVVLREPVPCVGMLGFWTLPDAVRAQVAAQIGGA